MLTAEMILATAARLATTEVDVPEWGGSVRVREMTGAERDSFEHRMSRLRETGSMDKDGIRAGLLVRTIIDPAGNRLFTDAETAKVSGLSGKALDKLFDAVLRLSKATPDAVEQAAGN
jgi:hypothetical protein